MILSTRPNICETHSEISTRVLFCVATGGAIAAVAADARERVCGCLHRSAESFGGALDRLGCKRFAGRPTRLSLEKARRHHAMTRRRHAPIWLLERPHSASCCCCAAPAWASRADRTAASSALRTTDTTARKRLHWPSREAVTSLPQNNRQVQ